MDLKLIRGLLKKAGIKFTTSQKIRFFLCAVDDPTSPAIVEMYMVTDNSRFVALTDSASIATTLRELETYSAEERQRTRIAISRQVHLKGERFIPRTDATLVVVESKIGRLIEAWYNNRYDYKLEAEVAQDLNFGSKFTKGILFSIIDRWFIQVSSKEGLYR